MDIKQKTILSKVVDSHADLHSVNGEFRCFQDGCHFKNNEFLEFVSEFRLSLCLYMTTSFRDLKQKKKHCGVHLILGNLQTVQKTKKNTNMDLWRVSLDILSVLCCYTL